jgi:dTDP-D-glucose 4,6-dehydratase
MAAALGVDNILENPIESISTNFHGSEIVLNAAQKYDKRILLQVLLKFMVKILSNHYLKLMIE